jgi:hypothetical protein
LLARTGNRQRQNVARRRHNRPTGIRLAQSQSAQPDLTAAAPGRVLAMAEQRSGASITDGAAQVRDPSYQMGARTPRPRPSNSVPPPLKSSAVQGDFAGPRIAVGPERGTVRPCWESTPERRSGDFYSGQVRCRR